MPGRIPRKPRHRRTRRKTGRKPTSNKPKRRRNNKRPKTRRRRSTTRITRPGQRQRKSALERTPRKSSCTPAFVQIDPRSEETTKGAKQGGEEVQQESPDQDNDNVRVP